MRAHFRKIYRIIVWMVLALFLPFLIWAFIPNPDLTPKAYQSGQLFSNVYLDDADKVLRITLADDEQFRVYTPLKDISDALIHSTLLYEDQHFYSHQGVDFFALVRAAWSSFIVKKRQIGASTITMQLARKLWKIDSTSIKGKLIQIYRALQLSKYLDKDEVLELYFNVVSYGGNIEGVGAASLIYFDKSPVELSELEAITLAVIPQNPNKRNPSRKSGLVSLYPARNSLIEKMIQSNPQKKYLKKYLDLPLHVRNTKNLPFLAPHFVDYIDNIIRSDKQTDSDLSGLTRTTLNLDIQTDVESLLKSYIDKRRQNGMTNAAAIVVDYKTMSIKSMVGSYEFKDTNIHGQVNGTLAKRSPGSTLKPFIYAKAIDEGIIHPLSLLKDTHQRYAGFSPENYDKQFLGPVSASDALILSRNVPAVYLQSELIKKNKQTVFYNFLKKAKIKNMKKPDFYGLALSLGGMETTMLELVNLYAMLANKGHFSEVTGLINDLPHHDNTSIISPEASFLTLDILKNNPPMREEKRLGIGSSTLSNDVSWKTGTSWAFRDAWSVGISKNYVIAVWVGSFKGESNPAFVGRTAAGPLLFNLFDKLNTQTGWKIESLFKTDNLNIKSIDVCKNTGDLDTKFCPKIAKTYFIPGVSPIKPSNVYREVLIDKKTGLRACHYDSSRVVKKAFAFWPSDMHKNFSRAGIKIISPPAYLPSCKQDMSNVGIAPEITSPQTTLNYVETLSNEPQKLALRAITDSDVKQLNWFVDDRFVASAKPNETVFWNLKAGNKTVKAIDDAGRVASVDINVIRQ